MSSLGTQPDVHAVVLPTLEGAHRAMPDVFDGETGVAEKHCAAVLDVTGDGDVADERILFLPDVSEDVRRAFALMVHEGTTLGTAQVLDASSGGGPYRQTAAPSNDYHGFDCGLAGHQARTRAMELRDQYRGSGVSVEIYAVPFLLTRIPRTFGDDVLVVILRHADGSYAHEVVRPLGGG